MMHLKYINELLNMHKIPMNRLILRKLDFHTKNDTKKIYKERKQI